MKSLTKSLLKRSIPTQVQQYRAFKRLIRNKKSYLYTSGWMRSLEQRKPIDKNGDAMPWMNFPIIKLLEERLTTDLDLFEFGSGYSTQFYAQKVNTVTSLEYDEEWYQLIKSTAPKNVTLCFRGKDIDGDYCRAIGSTSKKYDVVVIDGRDRVNCLKQSIPFLSPKGVLLLDDSQRERYREGIDFALDIGFREISFEGLKPGGNEVDRTTILYRDQNCFGI